MKPEALVASLPASVRIGPHDIALIIRDLPDEEGTFTCGESKIELRSKPSSNTVAVDTLVHEITHALFWVHAIQTTDEEHITGALATGWTQVYRDNPWLLGWIKKGVTQ